MIRKRFQRGNHKPKHPGTKSFLAEAQDVLPGQVSRLFQYKKMPKDKAMPKDLPGRQARCVQWIERTSPSPSFDEVDAVAIEQGGTDPSDFFWLGESDDESIMEVEEKVVIETAVWFVSFMSAIFVIWLLHVNFWINTIW